MAKKNHNPDYSPSKQHLLDLISLGVEEAKPLLKLLEKDKVLCNNADKLWNNHQYPDKHMKYVKSANYNQCRARFELSVYAATVLSLFEHVMHQSGLVQISLDEIKDKCNISLSSARRGVVELIDNGFIATYAPKTGKQAPIYMLNPVVAKAGKPVSENDINTFNQLITWSGPIEDHPLSRFQILQKRNDNVAIITQTYKHITNGDIVKFNSLHTIANKEKEPVDSHPTDSEIENLFN